MMSRNFEQSQLSVDGADIIPYDPASAKVAGTIGEAIKDRPASAFVDLQIWLHRASAGFVRRMR